MITAFLIPMTYFLILILPKAKNSVKCSKTKTAQTGGKTFETNVKVLHLIFIEQDTSFSRGLNPAFFYSKGTG